MTSKLLRPLGPFAFAAAFFALGVGGLVPIQAVFAQARALPDFVELVDQVGPSVVNIRTLEKISNRNVQGMPSAGFDAALWLPRAKRAQAST